MSDQPTLLLHNMTYSHPCFTVRAALDLKGLSYETVDMVPGTHAEEVEKVYGEGKRTVPGLLIDSEPVHGSVAILERLESLVPEPTLYPKPIADAVREAERWGDEELQSAARMLTWGALHFRPEALGTFAGSGILDPAGVDFSIRMMRGTWRYLGITAEGTAAALAKLPAQIDHVDGLVADGVIGGDQPTAADLQIGSSLALLLTIGDVAPLIVGRPAEAIAHRWFSDYPGDIPAGGFPAGWVPERDPASAS